MSEVVKLNKQKPRRQNTRVLVPIDQNSGAARYYARMMRDVEADLGGRRDLSRITLELIRAFCGSATRLEYFNHQILLGDDADVDLASFSQLASTMLRIGSRLDLSRRAKQVLDLDGFLALKAKAKLSEQQQQKEEGRSVERELALEGEPIQDSSPRSRGFR